MEKQRLKALGTGLARNGRCEASWLSGTDLSQKNEQSPWVHQSKATLHSRCTIKQYAFPIVSELQTSSYAFFVRKKKSSNWKEMWQGTWIKIAQQHTFHPTFILLPWECWVAGFPLHALSWNHTFCFLGWRPWQNKCGGKERSKGADKPVREREERKEIGGLTAKLSAKQIELVSPRAQGLYFEINRKTLSSFTCYSTYNEI